MSYDRLALPHWHLAAVSSWAVAWLATALAIKVTGLIAACAT